MRIVLDTSVFIAEEQGRPLDTEKLRGNLAVTVITVAELELGVRNAETDAVRARRQATLDALHTSFPHPLGVDVQVARRFAELVAVARRQGRKAKVQDCWIAAIAVANDAIVASQDHDYEALAVPAIIV